MTRPPPSQHSSLGLQVWIVEWVWTSAGECSIRLAWVTELSYHSCQVGFLSIQTILLIKRSINEGMHVHQEIFKACVCCFTAVCRMDLDLIVGENKSKSPPIENPGCSKWKFPSVWRYPQNLTPIDRSWSHGKSWIIHKNVLIMFLIKRSILWRDQLHQLLLG